MFLLTLLSLTVAFTYAARVSKPVSSEERENLTPQAALERLKAGNIRYSSNKPLTHDYRQQSEVASRHGQHPFAFVLNCMDARSVSTAVFNEGVGSIFTAGVAGNVVDTNMLASMEYAVFVGTRLIVVMGHTHCGAMEAACSNEGFGNIDSLLKEIRPAVSEIKGKLNCKDPNTINEIARNNVENMLVMIKRQSPYLADKIATHKIMLVGAMHNIGTGHVEFLGN